MGVDLCCRDVSMAKHLLYRTEVGAMVKEPRGKAMPQHVRRNPVRAQPGPLGQRLQFQREVLPCERA